MTVSGNIEAQTSMAFRGTFPSAVGNLCLDLLPVLSSAQSDGASRLDLLDTRCGRTEIYMLEPLHSDPCADSACSTRGLR